MSDDQIPLKDATQNSASVKNAVFTSIIRNSFGLGLFAVFTVGLISITWILTQEKIQTQVRAYEARALMEILPQKTHDNVLVDSKTTLEPSRLLSSQTTTEAYVALNNGEVSAVILPVIAPDGYNGRIDLLVGIKRDGSLAGVRAVTHKETPGLGDKINTNVSDWILSFAGKSLNQPTAEGWSVKKDGGDFDQFTGATITPRAVVAAVHRALTYFETHQKHLLNPRNIQQHSISEEPSHDQ
ncbi:electron transport complex subunit RsxG [uncultured Endozoicomonas sp.]|uniref:electron transport complex subunit RsxG n=1 Tax=uncultured Endozoicomonas sp. TaxID=432652 RepID=UPI00260BF21D|nr:electron transport complex subunit RsxG [uncultured Endozoicomonas sp.]